jgi:hypothetical protein
MTLAGPVEHMGEMRKCVKVEGKRSLGRTRRRWEENNRVDIWGR